jgi:hypothetical protein
MGKAIPVQAWTGPEGSRRLRLPDFKKMSTTTGHTGQIVSKGKGKGEGKAIPVQAWTGTGGSRRLTLWCQSFFLNLCTPCI